MGFSTFMCKQMWSLLDFRPGEVKVNVLNPRRYKEKVVIIMGATGTGKSRLSFDLASHFPAEIVNADKMQVYEGLPIVTNKVTEEEQREVPHHLLGIVNPNEDFTATNFCDEASLATESILGRGRLPLIVGGSNSYIEALIDEDVHMFRSKYECCFLWVDVAMPVLHSFVSKRIDQMLESGLVDELRKVFDPKADYSRGVRKAIGFPEFDEYLRTEPFLDKEQRVMLLQQAVNQMKENTRKLACCQLEKILRLRNTKGWRIHRLDATEVFQKHGKEAEEAWKELVSRPSTDIVGRFLFNSPPRVPANVAGIKVRSVGTANAAATH